MITLGQAVVSDALWSYRGQFARAVKRLRIDGSSEKRMRYQKKRYLSGYRNRNPDGSKGRDRVIMARPWLEMVSTDVVPVFADEGDFIMSAPARLKFGVEQPDVPKDSFFDH
jgi:hypothetical protein